MSWELITSGGIINAAELVNYEQQYVGEGQRARLELDLRMPVSQDIANQLQNELKQRGVAEVSVKTGSPLLIVEYRKGFPWLAVILAAILAIAVLAILIIGWRIFREVVPEALQPAIGTLLILAGIAVAGLVTYKAVKR